MHEANFVTEHSALISTSSAGFARFNPARMQEIAEQAGSHDIVYELVGLFLTDVQARMRDLATSVTSCNDDQRERVSHSIKGSCANLGAEQMAELARRIEYCPVSAAPELLRAIQDEFAALQVLLNQTYPQTGS
jgi:HPt (histidine-containing phosphotransfer) domain-containing protein